MSPYSLSPTFKGLWRLSLPLILTSLSVNLMFLLDRIILARYSVDAMNAVATAAMSCAIFQFMGVGIASIAEVFVGRYNGAQQYRKTPEPVWQMLWFSLSLFFLFWPLATWGGTYLLPAALYEEGKDFFWWIMMFGPFMAIIASLSAFFIGRGHIKLVTWGTLIGNLMNVALNLVLVFGVVGWFSPMGAKGAAIATVTSQVLQTAILACVFLNRHHRETFHTHKCQFKAPAFWECLKIGAPSAIGHMIEIAAWAVLFRIVAAIHLDYLTVQTIGNSVLVLFAFVTEGVHKGVTAIASNLIGSNKENSIKTLFRSALKLHGVFILIFAIPLVFYPHPLIDQFLPSENNIYSPLYQESLNVLKWVWIYFVFDGVVWISGGILMAGGDTRFIMWMNALGAWFFGIMPVYIVLNYFHARASSAWGFCGFYALANMIAFLIRYRSNRWRRDLIKNA